MLLRPNRSPRLFFEFDVYQVPKIIKKETVMVRAVAIYSKDVSKTAPIELTPTWTFNELARAISSQLGWQVGSVYFGKRKRLFSTTTVEKTLAEYHLANDETMLCVVLECDGGVGFGFSTMKTIKTCSWQPAPKWRNHIPGLNLEGTCASPLSQCEASGKRVIVPCGLGTFDIGECSSEAKCPICHQSLVVESVDNCAVNNCHWQYIGSTKGRRQEDSGTVGNECGWFPTDTVQWSYLKITTRSC
ncbi:hypothetical protein Pelo_6461 [Pelomyxa schiedti]|nr:hypothetical protein Pelo_6461 [Pelomyxa schiedti]